MADEDFSAGETFPYLKWNTAFLVHSDPSCSLQENSVFNSNISWYFIFTLSLLRTPSRVLKSHNWNYNFLSSKYLFICRCKNQGSSALLSEKPAGCAYPHAWLQQWVCLFVCLFDGLFVWWFVWSTVTWKSEQRPWGFKEGGCLLSRTEMGNPTRWKPLLQQCWVVFTSIE